MKMPPETEVLEEKGPPFDIGDYVIMDGDRHMKGLITAVTIRGLKDNELYSYEINWFNNGCKNEAWFEEWRLEAWEG